jgi:hypothetical protein
MARRSVVLAVLVAALAFPTRASAAGPPAQKALPEVVLYFGEPGADPFSAFGHVAICLSIPDGPSQGMCFDYGTAFVTSFSGLLWGFLRGQAEFQVVRTPEFALLARFRTEDRTLRRLVVPLAPAQVEIAAAKLRADTRDPTWRYRYDHQFDNCSTRVRDVLDLALGGAWAAATRGKPGPGASFRDLSRAGAGGHVPMMLLTDLVAGRAVDAIPDRWEAMFLPEVLRRETERFFGVPSTIALERRGPDAAPERRWGGREWFVIFGFLLGVPLAAARRWGQLPRTALAFAVVPLTLLGLAIWGLVFVSTLPAVRWNEVALVLVPFDLLLLFLAEPARRFYAQLRFGMLAAIALLVAVGVLRQDLHSILFIPLPAMLAVALLPLRVRRKPAPTTTPVK